MVGLQRTPQGPTPVSTGFDEAQSPGLDRGGMIPAAARRARILLVDDDERNLFAMEEVLADVGEVVKARSGEEALKRLLADDFAVILLDVFMPGMDGYETASLVRSRERSRRVPIIFLTAVNKDDAHMLRGYAMGAVDYVFKPVEPLILKSKVTVFVDLFEKTQEVTRKAEQEQALLREYFRVRTEKIVAEQALRRSEERQGVIIRSLPIALYAGLVGDLLLSPQFVGGNIEGITGFPAQRFQDTPGLWADRIHPEDRDRVLGSFERLGTTGSLSVEYRWRCADEQYRFLLDQAVLVRDDNDQPKEILGTLLDVSERRRLEQQLVLAQKMEAIGKLTGGIAHDFNNMLTVVTINLDRLRKALAEDARSLRQVEMALEGATRCADLTRQLLAFARRQPLQPKAVDLNDLVIAVADMVRRVLGEEIELSIDCGQELWLTSADPTQVESALLNLVVNARDAMPRGGTLRIATSNVRLGDEDRARYVDVTPGEYVSLSVSDTGEGIPPEIVDHVFEPFFTTKEMGRGSGLGLSIIYGFVKQSGGHLMLDTRVGRGTTITILLPRADAALVPASASAILPETDVPRAAVGEVVLAVEDDPGVRLAAVSALKDLGYIVEEAENAATALDALERLPRVDLLFTDLAMPGELDGRGLAAEAVRRKPGLRVLLTSAYADRLSVEARGTALRFLGKPYREPELAHAIRNAIDSD